MNRLQLRSYENPGSRVFNPKTELMSMKSISLKARLVRLLIAMTCWHRLLKTQIGMVGRVKSLTRR